MHGIAAITGNMHRSLRYFVLLERITSNSNFITKGNYWRVSIASETLSEVTQLKIGDVCLFICVDVRMSFCTLTLTYFCVRSVFDPFPNFTKLNPLV